MMRNYSSRMGISSVGMANALERKVVWLTSASFQWQRKCDSRYIYREEMMATRERETNRQRGEEKARGSRRGPDSPGSAPTGRIRVRLAPGKISRDQDSIKL